MINISEKKKCCGCSACKQVCPKDCITMRTDEEGFLYPHIDINKCVNCRMCENVCPVLNARKDFPGDPLCYAAYNSNVSERLSSSSGGIFCLLARKIIENGGVVFGAAMSIDCRRVQHIVITTLKDVERIQGSKYIQSEIGLTFQQAKTYLDKGVVVLFSGTPCEIEGLKTYLQKDYRNLFCVDVVCHGVPSPKLWEKYVTYRERCAGASLQKVLFRDKKYGWQKYSLLFEFTNNTEYRRLFYKDAFMQMFLQNLCLRPSCYDCSFKKKNRVSDITLGDFWGCSSICSELNDDKGLSMVLVHSKKGCDLLDLIKCDVICKNISVQEALKGNLATIESCKEPLVRKNFMRDINEIQFEKLGKKYLKEQTVTEKIKRLAPTKWKLKIKRIILNFQSHVS